MPEVKGLKRENGTTLSLFNVLQSTKHTLLLFTGPNPNGRTWKHLDSVSKAISERYGQEIAVCIVVAGTVASSHISSPITLLYDSSSALHKQFGADRESLYLIRPDMYIGFRSHPIADKPLWKYLQQLFITTAEGNSRNNAPTDAHKELPYYIRAISCSAHKTVYSRVAPCGRP